MMDFEWKPSVETVLWCISTFNGLCTFLWPCAYLWLCACLWLFVFLCFIIQPPENGCQPSATSRRLCLSLCIVVCFCLWLSVRLCLIIQPPRNGCQPGAKSRHLYLSLYIGVCLYLSVRLCLINQPPRNGCQRLVLHQGVAPTAAVVKPINRRDPINSTNSINFSCPLTRIIRIQKPNILILMRGDS